MSDELRQQKRAGRQFTDLEDPHFRGLKSQSYLLFSSIRMGDICLHCGRPQLLSLLKYRPRTPTCPLVMDLDFVTYLIRRFSVAVVLLLLFCLLPGPRALLDDLFDYLASEENVEAMNAGLHLSVIHFCWLFGFELPALEFPSTGDNLLTASCILFSILGQLLAVQIGFILWRYGWFTYYRRAEGRNEVAEFGGFEEGNDLPLEPYVEKKSSDATISIRQLEEETTDGTFDDEATVNTRKRVAPR